MTPDKQHKRDLWKLRADDVEADAERAPAPRYKAKPIKCMGCGTEGLHWKMFRKLGRRLADAEGRLHQCTDHQ